MRRFWIRQLLALFLALLVVLVPAAGYAANPYELTYTGRIGPAAVRLQLELNGAAITGSSLYNGVRGPFTISGAVDRLRHVRLQEYDREGRLRGVFDGRLPSLLQFYGTWAAPDGYRRIGFNLLAVPPRSVAGPAAFQAGIWRRIGYMPYESATLVISDWTPAGFHFRLTAFSGSRTGVLSGNARISDGSAEWSDPGRACRLQMVMIQDLLSIIVSGNTTMYAGTGVVFDGDYRLGDWNEPPPSLLDLGVLETPAQDRAFRELVGRFYERFVASFQLKADVPDLDGLNARVRVGWIRGFSGSDAAIIMIGADGGLYAAVLDGERIRYFTDRPAFRDRLPRTIERWGEQFPEKKLVWMDPS